MEKFCPFVKGECVGEQCVFYNCSDDVVLEIHQTDYEHRRKALEKRGYRAVGKTGRWGVRYRSADCRCSLAPQRVSHA